MFASVIARDTWYCTTHKNASARRPSSGADESARPLSLRNHIARRWGTGFQGWPLDAAAATASSTTPMQPVAGFASSGSVSTATFITQEGSPETARSNSL